MTHYVRMSIAVDPCLFLSSLTQKCKENFPQYKKFVFQQPSCFMNDYVRTSVAISGLSKLFQGCGVKLKTGHFKNPPPPFCENSLFVSELEYLVPQLS